MNEGATILIVDDTPENIRFLGELLHAEGYAIRVARSGEQALEQVRRHRPNLVLLDVVMPGVSGYEVCERLRRDPATRLLPVVMVTALQPQEERVRGLSAGANDFLSKPINREELLARVRSLLLVEELQRKIQAQAESLAEWNQKLEMRVREQVLQLERYTRMKSFFSPQIAEMILAEGGDSLLESHRREVTVVDMDLRGFTAFSEITEPEEVIAVLREYHEAAGPIVHRYEGTIDRFAGDGIMIFFGAPIPIENPEERAVRMAIEVRDAFSDLHRQWAKRGHDLGLGIGIGSGFATVGAIGFTGRWQYTALGTVANLASRLCDEARPGQILVSQRLLTAVEELVDAAFIGERAIRGLRQPVNVYDVSRLRASV